MKSENCGKYFEKLKIKLRPNAGPGEWLMFLLPLSLIVSAAKHPLIATDTYKLSSIFSVGLILSSLRILYRCSKNEVPKTFDALQLASTALIAVLFRICLHRAIAFSLWSAMFPTVFYSKIYFYVLEKLPKCFTAGEGGICSQGVILIIYFTLINIYSSFNLSILSPLQIASLIIQMGLVGVYCMTWITCKFQVTNPKKFHVVLAIVCVFIIFIPLDFLVGQSVLLWIFAQISEDSYNKNIFLYWVICVGIASYAIRRQLQGARKASTSIRKIFHIMLLAAFIPGLLYSCVLLYLSSGVVLGIFFGFELIRIYRISPMAETLEDIVSVFVDEKDAGIVALTHIYLLVGSALPLWIHPAPCDVTNSAVFNLLPLISGLLTIGVGDTAASVVGSNFGRHNWRGSSKTVEGTVACILSQSVAIYALIYFDVLKIISLFDHLRIAAAIITTSIIEAKTDQIDNLVLPLMMYIILI